jgi:hypothetical protein
VPLHHLEAASTNLCPNDDGGHGDDPVVLGPPLVYRLAKGNVRDQACVLKPPPMQRGGVVVTQPLLDCLSLKRVPVRSEDRVAHDLVRHGVEKRWQARRIVSGSTLGHGNKWRDGAVERLLCTTGSLV